LAREKDHATKRHKKHKRSACTKITPVPFAALVVLYLAAMILDDTPAEEETIEYSDTWVEEDLKDVSDFALFHSDSHQ